MSYLKSIASFYTNTWMCFYYINYMNRYLYVLKKKILQQQQKKIKK